MCRARVAYEAAVETIGKDVVAKSRGIEDAAIRSLNLNGSLLAPKEPYRLQRRGQRSQRLTPAKNS
jgi:hypothetical protein